MKLFYDKKVSGENQERIGPNGHIAETHTNCTWCSQLLSILNLHFINVLLPTLIGHNSL